MLQYLRLIIQSSSFVENAGGGYCGQREALSEGGGGVGYYFEEVVVVRFVEWGGWW